VSPALGNVARMSGAMLRVTVMWRPTLCAMAARAGCVWLLCGAVAQWACVATARMHDTRERG